MEIKGIWAQWDREIFHAGVRDDYDFQLKIQIVFTFQRGVLWHFPSENLKLSKGSCLHQLNLLPSII